MIVLGRVMGAYGLQGWLRIQPFADSPEAWIKLPQWHLQTSAEPGSPDSTWQTVKVLQARISDDNRLIAHLDTADDRTAAEALKGALIGVPRQAMPALAADEYYWHDLIGLEVFNPDNHPLGKVTGLLETGANAVLQVAGPDGAERLLPFVGAVIVEVDLPGGRLVADWGIDW